MQGELFLIGTPIGNLGDLSPRAADVLAKADFIAAEDTRVTLKLLNHLGLKKPMVSYYEHNRRQRGGEIAARILAGESCALVTDAGMPAVSDPGEELVALCAESGIAVIVIPGPCAAVAAVAASGLPCGRFCFEGFLSVGNRSRRQHLEDICGERRSMVFYEAPHKLRATLADLLEALGDRRIAIAREMTKMHEEIIRTTLSQACEYYRQNDPKGEFVLVIEGKKDDPSQEEPDEQAAVEMVRARLEQGQSHAQAVKAVAKVTGVNRSLLYKETVAGEEPGENEEGM
ncbi:MAG: 16S rRNA (cytidine(1402)-2'-O)-methyltransferase [Clostridia bacterium]|nr:16S rRNA (cytidine(1402)-2'-O)-methyltransferase [Clostridia bacterium]MDR3645028.1 16S rRNA (cytidine(1402)-2'-O)-methyltransferase [Clostridia bacterium]